MSHPWSAQLRPIEAVKLIWQDLADKGFRVSRDEFLVEMETIEKSYWERVSRTCQEQRIDEKISLALSKLGVEIAYDDPMMAQAVDKSMEVLETIWYDDLEPTLRGLLTRNLSIGVISNTSWPLPDRDVRFLSRFFNVIITSYEHGFRKPHQSIFASALEKLHVSPDEAIHVGNSKNDVVGARSSGMEAAFIKREDVELDADFILTSLEDILGIVDV